MNYSFQSWGSGVTLQVSALYSGERAEDFVNSHYESGTFATLHEGGDEIAELYQEFLDSIDYFQNQEI